ncbi:MAG: FGGY family carbohydrate kinase [Bacteroidota bacterium]
MKYNIGYDIGSSSIKAALVEKESGKVIAIVQEPQDEMGMDSQRPGWAEQDPEDWWRHICAATRRLIENNNINPTQVGSVGIAYQMHGLVLVDNSGSPIRKSIIWCDSRAVAIGQNAYEQLGIARCKTHLLNSPGNFTASKLKWVLDHEPDSYQKAYKFMLPGDYIAYRLTGKMTTTVSGLSEGILWDFKENQTAEWLLEHFGIHQDKVPELVGTFALQGTVSTDAARATGLAEGTAISYRAGDQPNNALSLNVFEPGEIAATGGTSGVVYAVTDSLSVQESERVNNFAHVNHTAQTPRIGKLLCINGAGILYRWMHNNLAVSSYDEMNTLADQFDVGSEGLCVIPFGNGAERMLKNQNPGVHIQYLDLNKHQKAHLCRASLEGIAFAFVYGMDLLKADGVSLEVMRVGNDNLFRSPIFSETIATLTGCKIEVYRTTGAVGAARASAIYEFLLTRLDSDCIANDLVMDYTPKSEKATYEEAYRKWKKTLEQQLKPNTK